MTTSKARAGVRLTPREEHHSAEWCFFIYMDQHHLVHCLYIKNASANSAFKKSVSLMQFL